MTLTDKQIKDFLIQLSFEMTASANTARACAYAMDCEQEDIYEISKYLFNLLKEKEE